MPAELHTHSMPRGDRRNRRERAAWSRVAGILFAIALAVAHWVALIQTAYSAPPETAPGQSANLLPDGRWLLTGGDGESGPLDAAAIRDPSTGQTIALGARLNLARTGHTATLLPDGSVLIFGGIGASGLVLRDAELFNQQAQRFELLPDTGLVARARHTATLLTDGRVLLAGGLSEQGTTLHAADLFNPRTRRAESFTASLLVPRSGHAAALLPSEPVLISGGRDSRGEPASIQELYDPQAQRFGPADRLSPSAPALPRIEASLPASDAADVAIDTLIAVRFSTQLAVQTLNSQTVTLSGPNGSVDATVVPAEGGLLLFVTPRAQLQPAARYTLFVSGAQDTAGNPLPFSAFSFDTAALRPDSPAPGAVGALSEGAGTASGRDTTAAPPAAAAPPSKTPGAAGSKPPAAAPVDAEVWIPGPEHMRGDWRSKRPDSALRLLPPLAAAPGVTALAGQVLRLDGEALANVTLSIGDKSVQSDETGRFLLAGIAAGQHVLLVDGTRAKGPGKTYGVYEIHVDIARAGQTQVLPYAIWMSRINIQHAVRIASPTTSEVVVTTPHIPNLELHIPPGIVIRDRTGQVVTEVSITPIPIDRTPFPLSTSHVPVFFTIQPGAARLQGIDAASARGARLHYPNYTSDPPGTRFNFWSYDPVVKGWYVYGQGQVSPDGRQVVPDAGVAIYEFTGAMIAPPDQAPPEGPPAPPDGGPPDNDPPEEPNPPDDPPPCPSGDGDPDCGPPASGGDPVDLATGLFVTKHTDLRLIDVRQVELTRTYRPRDTRSRGFGIGASHPYDMFLVGDSFPYTYQELILEDGSRVRFNRISPGTSWSDAVYQSAAAPGKFFGAILRWTGLGGVQDWEIRLRNGTVYRFPEAFGTTSFQKGALTYMADRHGNALTLARDAAGNLTRLTSPNGRYIDLTYDASKRVTQARDNAGATVGYTYDALGRLATVTDPADGVKEYTYDAQHRMLTLKSPQGVVHLTNEYDAGGRVIRQTQADGGTYQFSYTLDAGGKITQTEVTDPRGKVRRVTFNASGYPVSDVRAFGTPEQQAYVYERGAGTNLLLATIDPIGRRTERTYDANGNVLTITSLAGTAEALTHTYTYEPVYNKVASETDPLNRTTTYVYDGQGRLTSVTDPTGQERRFTYNAAGSVTSATTPLNQTTSMAYDTGDALSITDPLGRTTTRYTSAAGRTLAATDPLGRQTQYSYDSLGRLTKVTDPAGGETQYTYNAGGKLLSVTDPKGGATSYTYNSKNRLATRIDPLDQVESYAYDLMDNLVQHTDRKGQVATFAYDARNRLTQATYPDAIVTYTYDAGGRVTQISDTGGGTITRTYNSFDRLASETTPQGTVSYTYDAAGRRTGMTVAGQPAVTYSYDDADRLTGITRGSETVAFAYDAAGRRAMLTLPNGIVAAYSYDNADQLTGISYTRNGAAIGDLTYEYDQAGRRVRMGGSLARMTLPQAVATATYNAANQLTDWAGTMLAYDPNGNLAGDGTKLYTWDSRNRLTALGGATSAGFAYDALGRRASRTVSGASTAFLYDGLNAVQELSGATPTANILAGLEADQVFWRGGAAGSQGLLTDALGSVLMLTDGNGAVQTQYGYEPYGATIQSGAANDGTFQYTGRENDGTGLYYYRARYYDPQRQRFVSQDPIGLHGGINLYAYVDANPTNAVDPLGLDPYLPDPRMRPPGWDPYWPTGTDSRGDFSRDPNTGTKWYPHPEDDRHWPHYDNDRGERYPQKCIKPWPNQKQPPYDNQSARNPWTRAPKWWVRWLRGMGGRGGE